MHGINNNVNFSIINFAFLTTNMAIMFTANIKLDEMLRETSLPSNARIMKHVASPTYFQTFHHSRLASKKFRVGSCEKVVHQTIFPSVPKLPRPPLVYITHLQCGR